MLTITALDTENLILKSNYYYAKRIRKAVPNIVFDRESKIYVLKKKDLPRIEREFPGELFFKTPRWVIYGETPPDYSKMYKINHDIVLPKMKIPLFDYQRYGSKFMIDRILDHNFVLNADGVGLGKCHGKGTKILMYDGSIKNVEDIMVGEQLMGDDGTPRNVLSLARGREQMYKITLANGDFFTCNESHILSLVVSETYEKYQRGDIVNISVKEYLQLPKNIKQILKAYKKSIDVFVRNDLNSENKENADPYLYGLWLNDNCIKKLHKKGYISPAYKYADRKTRLCVLAGLLKNSNLVDGVYEINTMSDTFKEDVLFLIRSLGFSVSWTSWAIKEDVYYKIFVDKKIFSQKKFVPYSFFIESLDIDDYYGFTLDGNHLYLLGDFTVTHNTAQTISVMKWFIENENVKKILIICKKTIKKQWCDEIRKFTDLEEGFYIDWTPETKKKKYKVYDKIDASPLAVMVTNYHSFLNDTERIKSLNFDFVIIDEVHVVKAREGVINNHIKETCQGKRVVFLTGTPIMSKPADIFGVVQITSPEYFGLWRDFEHRYLTIDWGSIYGPTIVGAKHLDELRNKIQSFLIRRTEYEVAIELPETTIQNVQCSMDNVQTNILNEIDEFSKDINSQIQEIKELKEKTSSDEDKIVRLEAISKGTISLRQGASSDPRIFLRSGSKMARKYTDFIPKSYKMSAKTESLLDIVEDILGEENKVIIFSKFRMSAELIAEDIQKKLKVPAMLYTGAQNEEERNRIVDLFWKSDKYNVLIGTDAMAEGVNLQCAKYIINYDLPDTAAIYIQRIGRCRRTASKFSNVVCYNLLTTGSKDEERMENIENNKDVIGAFVDINEMQRKALISAQTACS